MKNRYKRSDVNDAIAFVQSDKVVGKYLYDDTWLSGENTTVYPVTVYNSEIIFQLWNNPAWKKSKENGFRLAIPRLNERRFYGFFKRLKKSKFKRMFDHRYCYFSKSDGSCPATIVLHFNGWLDNGTEVVE